MTKPFYASPLSQFSLKYKAPDIKSMKRFSPLYTTRKYNRQDLVMGFSLIWNLSHQRPWHWRLSLKAHWMYMWNFQNYGCSDTTDNWRTRISWNKARICIQIYLPIYTESYWNTLIYKDSDDSYHFPFWAKPIIFIHLFFTTTTIIIIKTLIFRAVLGSQQSWW